MTFGDFAQMIAAVVALLVLPALASVLLVVGIAGRRDATRPRCGRCRAALGFANADSETPCAVCGTLARDVPPLPTQRRPWILPLVGGLVAAGLAVAIFFVTLFVARSRIANTWAPAGMSNATLLNAAMVVPYSSDPTLAEVEARFRRGAITTDEIVGMVAPPRQPNEPAPPTTTFGARTLAALALESGAVDDAFAARVLDACFPSPYLVPSFAAAKNPLLSLDPRHGPSADDRLVRVVVVRSIQVDGKALDLGSAVPGGADAPLLLPLALRPWPEGARNITVDVELLLFSRLDAQRLRGPDQRVLRESDWPASLARTSMTLGTSVGGAPPEP